MALKQQCFALTICAYKKPEMEEEDYHNYVSEQHAPKLKDLLVKNKIVDYTMQHNTAKTRDMLGQIYGSAFMSSGHVADPDCFIQVVFKDLDDYMSVKDDPHYKQVVMPDHEHFADPVRTTMATGWFEKHVASGQAV